jgi:hypothetical protein
VVWFKIKGFEGTIQQDWQLAKPNLFQTLEKRNQLLSPMKNCIKEQSNSVLEPKTNGFLTE